MPSHWGVWGKSAGSGEKGSGKLYFTLIVLTPMSACALTCAFIESQSEREVQDPLNRGDFFSRKALFPSAWSSE